MVTKLFVMSDSHDDLEALARACDFAQASQANEIVYLGDFSLRPYTPEQLKQVISTQNVRAFVGQKQKHNLAQLTANKDILDQSKIPYTVIPGNYDSDLEAVFGNLNQHGKSRHIGEAKVTSYGGADGIPPHLALLDQLGELVPYDHRKLYALLNSEDPDIVVLHNPPHQLLDTMFNGDKVGTPAATKYVVENKPDLVLCGHIHESGPYGPMGANPERSGGLAVLSHAGDMRTYVVNPGNLGRFEIVDPRTLAAVKAFPFGTFAEVHLEEDGTPLRLVQYSLMDNGKVGKVKIIGEADFR